jgi:hypothetical protein
VVDILRETNEGKEDIKRGKFTILSLTKKIGEIKNDK